MLDLEIKEYLSKVGIRRLHALDTALIEAFGQDEGERHIERLTHLYDQSEKRLVYGEDGISFLHRQEEIVDYLNQSLQMSLLAASFYDHVFFKRVLEYLVKYDSFCAGELVDIGCGNGILTCFLALRHPEAVVTGIELSQNAVLPRAFKWTMCSFTARTGCGKRAVTRCFRAVQCMKMSYGERSAKSQNRHRCPSRNTPDGIAHMQQSLRRTSSPKDILSV